MSDPLTAREVVRGRIAAAAERTGRAPEAITLVAVSKTVAPERIPDPAEDDAWVLGENRVQEFVSKRNALAERIPPIRWHFIGPLQRNKVRGVVGAVELIHGVDSPRLADAIGRRARDLGIVQDVLLEVNTSGEPTKHGVAPEDAPAAAARIAGIDGVALRGFMTMAAPGDPEGARANFRALRIVRDSTQPLVAEATQLSMGMSGDFEVAVEEGATIVRVGTAIFGPRPPDR